MYRSFNGKRMFLIFAALLLLITSYATTPHGQTIDLTGVWTGTYENEGCPGVWKSYTKTEPIKITQEGNRITVFRKSRNRTSHGILKDNIIAFKKTSYPAGKGGIIIIPDYNYILSEDMGTIKGIVKWSYADSEGGPSRCTGTSKLILERKPNKKPLSKEDLKIMNKGRTEAEQTKPDSVNLNGTWIVTDDWEGCGTAKLDTWTIKIIQEGNKLTITNVERNGVSQATKEGNIIYVKGIIYSSRYGGNTIVPDYQLTISKDSNSLEGIVNWSHDSGCEGVSKVKYVRKIGK